MTANVSANETLLKTARETGGPASEGTREKPSGFVSREKLERLIDMFGSIEYDEGYDYKKMRAL